MAKNRVNATVEPEAIESVMQAIADIRGFLPFLIDLSLEERKTLARMGDKSRAFVDRAYDLAVQNPDFLPRSFSIDDMKMSVELFDAMHPLIMAIRQLLELMDDTYKARRCRCLLGCPGRFTTMPKPAIRVWPLMKR